MRSGSPFPGPRLLCIFSLALAALLAPASLLAQGTAPALNLGTVAVGSALSGTVTFTFSASTTVSAISVVTQGAPNLDFTLNTASPGTCTTTTYAANATCTVNVTFTPLYPGRRLGAVVLGPATAAVGTGYIYGIGNGSLVLASTPTLATTFSTTLNVPRGPAIDGSGNVYINEQGGNKVDKFSPSGTLTVLATGLSGPSGGVVDGAGNYFYTAQGGANLGELPGGVAGTPIGIPLGFNPDNNLEVDGAGNLYTSCYTGATSGEIVEIAATTHTITTIYSGGTGAARFIGMGIDAAGNLYPVDYANNILYELPVGASTLTTLVTGGNLNQPDSVSLDAAGNIYVTNNQGTLNILRYTAKTYALTVIPSTSGESGIVAGPDGTLYSATFGAWLLSYTRNPSTTVTVSGVTAAGSTSAEQTIALENDGTASVTVTPIAAAGPAVQGSSTTCATIASAGVCVVGIEFAPTVHGPSPQKGTLTLSNVSPAAVITISGDVSGDPTQLAFTPAPTTPLVAGQNAGTISVTLEDSTGAVAVNDTTAPVTLTVTGPASYTQTYGPVNAVNSVATFNTSGYTFTKPGTYTYTATSTGLTSAAANETVNGGPPVLLAIVPGSVYAVPGGKDYVTLTEYDAYGNIATSSDSIALTSTDASAVYATPVTLSNGTATTSVSFMTSGNQTVTGTDTTNTGVPAATSTSIYVSGTATFTVTSTADDGTGTCTDQSKPGATLDSNCQLRVAIVAVNALNVTGTTAAQPTVNFSSSLYGKTITLTQSTIGISANINIAGPGPAQTITINGNNSNIMTDGTAGTLVSVSGLSFTSGSGYGFLTQAAVTISFTNDIYYNFVETSTGLIEGSALILNGGATATITGCTFSNNKITASGNSAYGGAVYQSGGTLTIASSVFSGNTATASALAEGGALYVFGIRTSITGTTFTGNQNTSTGSSAIGGALYAGSSPLTITNSLFSNNLDSGQNTQYGGALYMANSSTSTITGSTFTGNVVTGPSNHTNYGGAIYSTNTTVNLYNDTITGNLATDLTNVTSSTNVAGGYYSLSVGYVTAYNTVISGNYVNSVSAAAYRDERVVTVTAGYGNYIDTSTSPTCTANCAPLLSTLGNYGGPTQTLLPLPGSPLLAGGVIAKDNSAPTDGRGTGYSRTTTYNGTAHIDIGAAESNYTLGFVQQPTNTVVSQTITPSPTVQLYESAAVVAPNLLSTTPTLSAGQTTANFPATGTGGALNITASEGTLAGTLTENTSTSTLTPGLATFGGLSIATLETDDTLTATIMNSAATVLASTTSGFFDIVDSNATLNFIVPPNPNVANGNTACNSTVGAAASCIVTVGLYKTGTGAVDTTSSASVTLTVSATGYTTQIYTANAMNGVATFNLGAVGLTINGTYTYAATATTYTLDTASATEIVGAPGTTIANFVVAGVPSTVPAGISYSFTVTAINASGTTDTAFTGPVFLTSSDPAAVFLPQNYTYNTSDAGVHTFTVVFNTGGLQSITATTDGGQTGSETNIRVVVEYIWLANTTGTVDKLTDVGTSVTGAVGTSATASTLGGIAFDSSGNVWSVTNANNALDFNNKTGTASATYSGGGLNAPVSLMVDGNGYVWIANSGNASVSVFNSAGIAASGTAGYGASTTTQPIGASPSGLAIDNTGGVWVTSSTGNSVTHLVGAAAPVTTPTAAAVANTAVGVAP